MATSPKHVVIIGHGLSGCSVAKELVDRSKKRGAPSITITVIDSRDFYESDSTDTELGRGPLPLTVYDFSWASIDACQRESVHKVSDTNLFTWTHGPTRTAHAHATCIN